MRQNFSTNATHPTKHSIWIARDYPDLWRKLKPKQTLGLLQPKPASSADCKFVQPENSHMRRMAAKRAATAASGLAAGRRLWAVTETYHLLP
ncbi:MAG: hypothetical protein ABJX82_05470 [Paracoccaceae bacterium]